MQPRKILLEWLQQHTNRERYLFSLQDIQGLFPELSDKALKTLLSRVAKQGALERVCRGLYAYKSSVHSYGFLLFHAAAYLRSNAFNYISLETLLSDAGVISQIPINCITIMSSGSSNKIVCGRFGTIEFIHTAQKPTAIMDQLTYDKECRLWRASISLALRDMKRTHRNCDLIDWEVVDELI
jgi:predicted transcriptional regulator of viral defense system